MTEETQSQSEEKKWSKDGQRKYGQTVNQQSSLAFIVEIYTNTYPMKTQIQRQIQGTYGETFNQQTYSISACQSHLEIQMLHFRAIRCQKVQNSN